MVYTSYAEEMGYCRPIKLSRKGFFLGLVEILMKYWLGISHLVMRIVPIFQVDRPMMTITYRYNSWKTLHVIADEGGGSTVPGDPCLFHYPDHYYNVGICSVVHPTILGRNYNAYNSIEQHKKMWQCDLALEKYLVTQTTYFRIGTTVALGMEIADATFLFCHSIEMGNKDKGITTRDCNGGTVFDCFNNPFSINYSTPSMNLPHITIADSPHPPQIGNTSVASEDSLVL